MDHLPENITYEIIIAFLNRKTSDDESRMIKEWIESSDENKRYIEDLKAIWSEAGNLNPPPVNVNADAAWNKLSSRIESSDHKVIQMNPEKGKSNVFYKTILKIAAVLIPVLIILSIFLFPKKDIKQIVIVTTDSTQQKQLSDGSVIKMNVNSKLTYPEKFSDDIREVSLEGEAFFEITPDKKKPFIIHSYEAEVKVVGTSFNVSAYKENDNIEVFVKTGTVQLYGIDSLTGDTSMVELLPGNKGFFNRKTKIASKEEGANENNLFWMNRTLVFSKTKLSEVVEILNENYDVEIELKNKNLSQLRLSATFKDQTIDTILDIIATSFDLSISKTDSTYTIDGEGN